MNLPAFEVAFSACPLVAILRGVRPEEAVDIGEVLAAAGFTLIEVPLNSPDPLRSIESLARRFGGTSLLIGAGTVLKPEEVQAVGDAGGRLIVSPNVDTGVIAATLARGMASLPGFLTPSEAFIAVAAGAHALKLFPAEASSPQVLRAQRAVLPPALPVLAVGGITPDSMRNWLQAGAAGFGLGAALYKPGDDASTVKAAATRFVTALRESKNT